MPRDCLLIRAVGVGADEINLARAFFGHFGRHIYFVLDRYSDEATEVSMSPTAEIYVGGKFLKKLGVPYFNRVGWQCGDLCLYAAASKIPYYDQYWMIEGDVRVTLADPTWVFKSLDANKSHFIGSNFGKRGAKWWWHKTMPHHPSNDIFGSCFPLSRFSFEAIQFLLEQRVRYFQTESVLKHIQDKNTRLVANDEAFVATTLASAGFSCDSLAKIHPDLMTHFSANIPIHEQEIIHLPNKILHPVCNTEKFVKKFSRVRKSNLSMASRRMEEFILHLGEDSWLDMTSISPEELRPGAAM